MKAWKRVVLITCALLLLSVACRKYFWWGYKSPDANDTLLRTASRRHYLLRHLQWSGIAPFEGGFIPDPHYNESEVISVPASVLSKIQAHSARYALVDVNPGFNDNSSEILLLIESDGRVSQYSLDFPKHRGVQAILGEPMPPAALMFPYKSQIAVAANFCNAKGIYLLPLPLRTTGELKLIPPQNTRFAEVSSELKTVAAEPAMKAQFCGSRRKDFISYYEKFAAPCDIFPPLEQSVEATFSEFWLRE